METLSVPLSARPASLWRDTICPKEHGSWSLAFEPIALGLLVAPSVPGAFFGLALAAGFFARRPLRMAVLERREPRRQAAYRALAICGSAALTAFAAVLLLRGVSWLTYLVPTLVAGAAFAWFDARGD